MSGTCFPARTPRKVFSVDELNLDFTHDVNSITRFPPAFVTFNFYLTDSIYLRHTVLHNEGTLMLWQWGNWSPYGGIGAVQTLGDNPLGFAEQNLPVPVESIGELLSPTLNPLNGLMWAHSFTDEVSDLSSFVGEWLSIHKFQNFNHVTDGEKVWLQGFELELDERLWAMQERLELEVPTTVN